MPLDFVIASDKSEAVKLYPDLSLEDDDHESLLLEINIKNRPFLNRISDYYTDAVFQGGDLAALKCELEGAENTLPVIKNLAELVENALHQNKNIYVFAD